LTAPSIGGRSAVGAFLSLIGFLRILIPVVLAFAVVFWAFEKRDRFTKFAISWLAVFGVLTILRFLADPKFWLDWTSWLGEVEVGVALVLAKLVSGIRYQELSKRSGLLFLISGFLFLVSWTFVWEHRGFWLPTKSVENRVEYKLGKKLSEIVKSDETVFLSGSTAFWLNSFFDIKQVRGGADQGSVNRKWREAAWEIREGSNGQKSYDWLSKLGVKYLVVHTQNSAEFYHDFKNYDKFSQSAFFKTGGQQHLS